MENELNIWDLSCERQFEKLIPQTLSGITGHNDTREISLLTRG
jgi:hypothetical protein